MLKRIAFAGCVAMFCGAAQAQQDDATKPETGLLPVVTREVCTTTNLGFDAVHSDCRTEVNPAPAINPALKGICTIYYGHRVCH